jgi:hypothetical protein
VIKLLKRLLRPQDGITLPYSRNQAMRAMLAKSGCLPKPLMCNGYTQINKS